MPKSNLFLTDDQVDERLVESEVEQEVVIEADDLSQVKSIRKGGGTDRKLTEEQRFAIGVLGSLEGPSKVHDEMGISKDQASRIANGVKRTNGVRRFDDEDKEITVKDTKDSIIATALDRVTTALETSDPSGLDTMKKVTYAERMTRIVASLEGGKSGSGQGPNVAVVFNVPEQRKIENCKVIDVD